jgi:3-oxoacyl-[acyl-carrier protein] reductase
MVEKTPNAIYRRLAGKTAVVTGAAQGVGKGIALALAREGCAVAVIDNGDPEIAEATVAKLKALGVESFHFHADVGSAAQVNSMMESFSRVFSPLDLPVNNAGVQTWKPLLDLSEQEWDWVMNTNLKGCFLCTQAAARQMKPHGCGSIVTIGSGSNKLAFPNLAAYTTSKGGIEMFTKAAAAELGPFGIRVNCVAPGAIEVERTRLEDPEYAKTWGQITPLKRVGTPEDVGDVVVFLASKDARFVNGQTIWVDGGLFTQAPWPYSNR